MRKAQKPCREFGCQNLTRNSYCKIHEKNAEENQQENTRLYNRYGRDPGVNAFYKSTEWQRVRAVALARDNHLCQRCLKRGILTPAKVVHHLVEVKQDWSRRLELQNLESFCHSCHNQEHKRLPRG